MLKKLSAVFAATLFLIFLGGSTAETRPSDAVQQKTQEIVFGSVRTYDHKSGWFSLTIPGNWTVSDKSGEGEVIVSIIDPTENGVIVVRVYQPSRGYTQAALGDLLKGFLNERMGSFDGFSMGEAKSQRDGSLGLYFKYNSVVEGVTYKMYGDAFIEQHNGLIGVLTMIMPQEQYEAKQKSAYEVVNSFRVTGAAP
jgi:serine/threonine-protein kinase